MKRSPLYLWGMTALLISAALSRWAYSDQLWLHMDEVWSVWQTFGTPAQIIAWTPYDWPPGYYLLLGAWRALVGQEAVLLRTLSIFSFLLGMAACYRIGQRLHTPTTGLLAAVLYALPEYILFLSTEVRAYAVLLGLAPLVFWALLRYFDRPSPRRGITLGAGLASLFYLSLTAFGAFLIFGLYTLVVYPRRLVRWWLPALVGGGLALPEVLDKLRIASTRATAPLPPFPTALVQLTSTQWGNAWALGAALLVVASAVWLWRGTVDRRMIALLLWALGGVWMYLLQTRLGFFSAKYAWWILLGLALWLAYSLSRLPRRASGLIALGASVFPLWAALSATVSVKQFSFAYQPLESNLAELQQHISAGDVLLLDPLAQCGAPEIWDYHLRTFFPQGVQFIPQATPSQRRIWYVGLGWQHTPALFTPLEQGRITQKFFGPPECLFQLYEAPPDPHGLAFENGLRFLGYDVMVGATRIWTAPLTLHPTDSINLRLWWSVDRPLTQDYSFGVYALNAAGELISSDSPSFLLQYPPDSPTATSQWAVGSVIIQTTSVQLLPTAKRGAGKLFLAVYDWRSGERVAAKKTDAQKLLPLRDFYIMAY